MRLVELCSVVEPVASWNPIVRAPHEPIRYIDIGAVDSLEKRVTSIRTVLGKVAPSRARQLVLAGDVLVSTVRPNLNAVAGIDDELAGATASTGFCVLRPRAHELNHGYLLQWVKSTAFVAEMVRRATGASYPAVSDAIVFESKIPLPPLAEQRRIAEVLDRAETLRAQRRQALAQLDALAESIFLDMFGNPTSNSRGWPVVPVDMVCSRITVGIVVQPASYYTREGVPALRSLNVRANRISRSNLVFVSSEDNDGRLSKTRVWAGDVLLVRSGQPGTCAIVPPDLNGANAIDILIATPRPDVVNPTFLCFFFNSDAGKAMALGAQRGQVQKHLNVGSLREALLPLPPLTVQNEFATRLDAVARIKARQEDSARELDALFASLQHRAFCGEL